jgi:hypothetical protein
MQRELLDLTGDIAHCERAPADVSSSRAEERRVAPPSVTACRRTVRIAPADVAFSASCHSTPRRLVDAATGVRQT